MQIPILSDIVIILGLSVVIVWLFDKFRIPNILGFLIAGVVAGPHAFSLVNNIHEVEVMAEIGVILLMFIIGVETSLKELRRIGKSILFGGGGQVLLTTLIVFPIAYKLGMGTGKSLFMGFLLSLSSTAIVLQILQKKNDLSSPHGKNMLSVLIFQDIIVVPMMLAVPFLAGDLEKSGLDALWIFGKGMLVIFGVLILAKYLVPLILRQVTKAQSRELFLLTVVVICFSIGWGTSLAGLSIPLGAFLAGMVISESEYSYQAMAHIKPFYDLFSSFFFISVGMLLDVNFVIDHPLGILLLVLMVLVLKTFAIGVIGVLMRFPLRTLILVSLGLAQVGEFSFILSKAGMKHGLIDDELYQYFLSVSVLTMGVTPFLLKLGHKFSSVIKPGFAPWEKARYSAEKEWIEDEVSNYDKIEDHLVIIGYGLNGKNLSQVSKSAGIPYLIVDMNVDTVTDQKEKGEPIIYGDAIHEEVLHHLKVDKARVVSVAISDVASTRRIVSNLKRKYPSVHVIVRTRYVNEVDELKKLGANQVIPEEFETSIEIFSRVLNQYLVPQKELEAYVQKIRSDSYEVLRHANSRISLSGFSNLDHYLSGMRVVVSEISNDSSLVGETIADAEVRKKFGVTILAIEAPDGSVITNPSAEVELKKDSKLILLGTNEQLKEFEQTLVPHPKP